MKNLNNSSNCEDGEVTCGESESGNSTGELKHAAVATLLHKRLPAIAGLVFTPKQINVLIKTAVTH